MTCESCTCSGCSCQIKKFSDGSRMVSVNGDVKLADPECQYIGKRDQNVR